MFWACSVYLSRQEGLFVILCAVFRSDSDSQRDVEEDMPALQPLGLSDLHQLLTLIIAVLRVSMSL